MHGMMIVSMLVKILRRKPAQLPPFHCDDTEPKSIQLIPAQHAPSTIQASSVHIRITLHWAHGTETDTNEIGAQSSDGLLTSLSRSWVKLAWQSVTELD